MYHEPDEDPVCRSCTGRPDAWYKSNLHIFLWIPFRQFCNLLDIKSIGCIHGCNCGSLRLTSFKWRPMFHFDKIIWVLHHRIHCQSCGRTFRSIDPRFLAKIPTRVAERFPFVTTASGPGMHVSMIFQFTSLVNKGILYGTYAKIINEMHRIRYDMSQISYYDTVCDMMTNFESSEATIPPIQAFSNFDSPGEFGGIKLEVNLLKACLRSYMRANEHYFQISFQMHYDDGNAGDHTHKMANLVRSSGRRGKVFTASYTVTSKLGFVNMNRLTMTKGTFELCDLLKDYKETRNIVGAPALKRYESDNLNHDGGLWKSVFHDELTHGVIPYKPPNDNLPIAGINEDSYEHLESVDQMNDVSSVLISKFENSNRNVIYGFDLEWNKEDQII